MLLFLDNYILPASNVKTHKRRKCIENLKREEKKERRETGKDNSNEDHLLKYGPKKPSERAFNF